MRSEKKRRPGTVQVLRRLGQVPLLYAQFVRYQRSPVGVAIALTPVLFLVLSIALLVI